ncbi:MSMEG_1061 family FMN-dependent PPOX-type flavoprotein [Luteipulveratus halotolerans]|uniref:Pyridoxamine 5'-phosphate oxidase n=1 Tax=Luteipulveratus halotolerans TaxID=1631356 RepID=A0A0L6CIC0_9MICO|nr:MSMEG_1061 family FMN-dependent PPOX-type flavoprotein [Luteipulveratus halotolerans]KNX37541.1 pyridoxamine 5'-phosphate oxidase [Luteipulveratus halotolerans]
MTATTPSYADLPQITDEAALVDLLGTPSPAVRDKARTELHDLDIQWLAASPLCFVGTSDAHGGCDVSPKGDPAGFVRALDRRTVAVPERAGNKRADGYKNILVNPHVGLNLLIPGRGDTLRINGTARLVTDGPFFDDMVVKGHRPVLVMLVSVEQVFYHCAKAFLRSQTWKPETWQPDAMPRHAVIAKELVRRDQSLEDLDRYYGASYADGLYPDNTTR